MIKSISFINDHRCFKKMESYHFEPGINLLVGDQGCGKSTLIDQLYLISKNSPVQISYEQYGSESFAVRKFDFEKDNLRTIDSESRQDVNLMTKIGLKWKSHGQANNLFLKSSLSIKEKTLFLLDEPDMALSIRSCHKLNHLFRELAKSGHQIIAAVHNPLVIKGGGSSDCNKNCSHLRIHTHVLSLEHKAWLKPEVFIKEHDAV